MRVDWCVSSWFRIKNTHSHKGQLRALTVGRQKTRLRGSRHTNPRYPTRPKDIHLENLERTRVEFILITHTRRKATQRWRSGRPDRWRVGHNFHSLERSRGLEVGYPLAALGSEDWCDPVHGGVFSDGRPSVHGVAPSPTAPASSRVSRE